MIEPLNETSEVQEVQLPDELSKIVYEEIGHRSDLGKALTGFILLLSGGISLLDSYTHGYRYKPDDPNLNENLKSLFTSDFFEHMGNVKHTFLVPLIIYLVGRKSLLVLHKIGGDRVEEFCKIAEIFFPYILITIFWYLNLDVETPYLPISWGTESLGDALVGLIGLMGLAASMEVMPLAFKGRRRENARLSVIGEKIRAVFSSHGPG